MWTSYVYTYIPEPPSHPFYPTTLDHQAELSVLYNSFPLAICFIHGSVYMSMLKERYIYLLING